jgi:hypothetical protein
MPAPCISGPLGSGSVSTYRVGTVAGSEPGWGPRAPPGLFPRAREGRGGRRPDQFRGRFAADLRLARSDHAAIRSQLRDAGGSADKDMAEVTR